MGRALAGAEGIDLKAEFSLAKAESAAVALGGLAIYFIMMVTGIFQRIPALVFGSFAVLFGAVIVGLALYRCPSCRGYPGRSFWGYPRHCQNCGVLLE